jgi:hypothetical protein
VKGVARYRSGNRASQHAVRLATRYTFASAELDYVTASDCYYLPGCGRHTENNAFLSHGIARSRTIHLL